MSDVFQGESPVSKPVTEKPMKIALAVLVALSVLFILFPGIDLAVTGLFYVPGEGFPASRTSALVTIRAIGQYVPLTLTIVLVTGLILKLNFPDRPSLFAPRFAMYFSSLFLLGPALLVNGIMKPIFDRPRPRNVLEFGGDDQFIAAWHMGGGFFDDRSFVSGEAAVVACLLPLAFFVPVVWRRMILVLLGIFAVLISFNRIAFGAHFLSDVLISWSLMIVLSIGLWHLIYVRPGIRSCDIIMEQSLTSLGHRLIAMRRSMFSRVGRLLLLRRD